MRSDYDDAAGEVSSLLTEFTVGVFMTVLEDDPMMTLTFSIKNVPYEFICMFFLMKWGHFFVMYVNKCWNIILFGIGVVSIDDK